MARKHGAGSIRIRQLKTGTRWDVLIRHEGKQVLLAVCTSPEEAEAVRARHELARPFGGAKGALLSAEDSLLKARANAQQEVRKLPMSIQRIIWHAIKRCHDETDPSYDNYGGRGIKVCPEWRRRGGAVAFYQHMGPRPSPEHTVDHIDNDRGYEPGNVRWATRKEQAENRRPRKLKVNEK